MNLTTQKWKELTDEMTYEEFKNFNPFLKKNCADCIHLKGAISLWCTNKNASKARGTSIPGVSNCPFWQVDWNQVEQKHKTIENGFVEKPETAKPEKPKNKLSVLFAKLFKK